MNGQDVHKASGQVTQALARGDSDADSDADTLEMPGPDAEQNVTEGHADPKWDGQIPKKSRCG